MTDWQPAETNTHQDHVIAHVLGATVEGHFIRDETAFLLLDIGFIWNIYLDGEMGLVPQRLAIDELEASLEIRQQLSAEVDAVGRGVDDSELKLITIPTSKSPIETVDFSMAASSRRLVLTCEENSLIVETSVETAEVKIYER
jgi:hypothetical protein